MYGAETWGPARCREIKHQRKKSHGLKNEERLHLGRGRGKEAKVVQVVQR